jgi:glucan-binding YG repeat protein
LRAIKTAPASRNFAVKVGDTVYYGNLSTNTKTGAVRLNVGGTTYYLNDNDYLNQ